VIKDDMAIHAGVPEKVIKAALKQIRSEEEFSEVTWDVARHRPGRPIKVYFEAAEFSQIQSVKKRLEQCLNDSGFDLYP